MKQTAVEWLEEYIKCSIQLTESEKKWFNQAKEMEKDQIIKAVDFCLASVELSEDKNSFIALSAEQYYNEKFVLKTI